MTVSEKVEEAFRAFERWRSEHDPDGVMNILDAAAAYAEWSTKNRIDRYLDSAQPAGTTPMIVTHEIARLRIAEIDKMFEEATGWGSWMITAANEREALANRFGFEHKYLARTSSDRSVD